MLLTMWKYVMDQRQTLRDREKADIHFLNALQLADLRAICREDTPGWVHFQEFEHVHWLNVQLQEVWKYVDRATSHLVKEVVEPMLDSYKPPGVSSLAFKRFKLGSNAPRIEGVKVQRLVEQQVMVCVKVQWLVEQQVLVDINLWLGGVKVQWLVEQQVMVDINLCVGGGKGQGIKASSILNLSPSPPCTLTGVKVQRLVEQQVMVDMNLWVGGGSSIILAIASMGVKMHVQVRAGQVHVQVRAGQVHVQLKDLELRARLRLILQLGEQLPCIDAVVISIHKKPRMRIEYKLKAIGGQLSSIPGLAGMIESTVHSAIESTLMWPERIVVPLAPSFDASATESTLMWPERIVVPLAPKFDASFLEMHYEGSLVVTAWKAEGLKNVDMMSVSDPFAILWTHGKHKAVTRTIDNDLNPVWNETFELPVDDIHTAELFIQVDDEDSFGSQNLGYAMYPLVGLLDKDTVQTVTLTLLPKLNNDRMLGIDHKLGRITLQMVYRSYTPEEKVQVTAAEKARDPKVRDCPLDPDAAQRAFAAALLSARHRKLSAASASQGKRAVCFSAQSGEGDGAAEGEGHGSVLGGGEGGGGSGKGEKGGGGSWWWSWLSWLLGGGGKAGSGADGGGGASGGDGPGSGFRSGFADAAAAAVAEAAAAEAAEAEAAEAATAEEEETEDGDADADYGDGSSSKAKDGGAVGGRSSNSGSISQALGRRMKKGEGQSSGKFMWGSLKGWTGGQKAKTRRKSGEGGWDVVADKMVESARGRELKRSFQVSRESRREGGGEEWEDEDWEDEEEEDEEEEEEEESSCVENGEEGEIGMDDGESVREQNLRAGRLGAGSEGGDQEDREVEREQTINPEPSIEGCALQESLREEGDGSGGESGAGEGRRNGEMEVEGEGEGAEGAAGASGGAGASGRDGQGRGVGAVSRKREAADVGSSADGAGAGDGGDGGDGGGDDGGGGLRSGHDGEGGGVGTSLGVGGWNAVMDGVVELVEEQERELKRSLQVSRRWRFGSLGGEEEGKEEEDGEEAGGAVGSLCENNKEESGGGMADGQASKVGGNASAGKLSNVVAAESAAGGAVGRKSFGGMARAVDTGRAFSQALSIISDRKLPGKGLGGKSFAAVRRVGGGHTRSKTAGEVICLDADETVVEGDETLVVGDEMVVEGGKTVQEGDETRGCGSDGKREGHGGFGSKAKSFAALEDALAGERAMEGDGEEGGGEEGDGEAECDTAWEVCVPVTSVPVGGNVGEGVREGVRECKEAKGCGPGACDEGGGEIGRRVESSELGGCREVSGGADCAGAREQVGSDAVLREGRERCGEEESNGERERSGEGTDEHMREGGGGEGRGEDDLRGERHEIWERGERHEREESAERDERGERDEGDKRAERGMEDEEERGRREGEDRGGSGGEGSINESIRSRAGESVRLAETEESREGESGEGEIREGESRGEESREGDGGEGESGEQMGLSMERASAADSLHALHSSTACSAVSGAANRHVSAGSKEGREFPGGREGMGDDATAMSESATDTWHQGDETLVQGDETLEQGDEGWREGDVLMAAGAADCVGEVGVQGVAGEHTERMSGPQQSPAARGWGGAWLGAAVHVSRVAGKAIRRTPASVAAVAAAAPGFGPGRKSGKKLLDAGRKEEVGNEEEQVAGQAVEVSEKAVGQAGKDEDEWKDALFSFTAPSCPYEDIPGGKALNKGKGKGGVWPFAKNVKNVGRALRGMKGGTKCVYSPEELRDRLDDRREEMERMAEMEGKRANADMDLD
ncbi:unnamed protein product [Closterium sp. NIES-64]|nr:unnamed protein product [Closterium sp. NIES-64]